jgi:hypothetical protein
MKRLAALVLIAVSSLLAGCATYDDYAYYDRDGYYEDEYYGDRYHRDRYYYDRYGNRVYYNDYDVSYRYGGVGYGLASWSYPDYFVYNYYYSTLWPTYRYYYDPFWSPGFYYGVTFFPRTYFGLNVGWHSWPYYHAYSPYRHSHADHYYDWWDYSRHRAADRQRYYGNHYLPRYGSARNEAQALARRTGAAANMPGNAYYGGSVQPGSFVDPMQARQAHARGQTLPFERGARDWNVDPYGRDGRGYRGFAEGATPAGSSAREQLGRGGAGANVRGPAPYEGQATRPGRGYERGPMPRDSGHVTPMPDSRTPRSSPYRNQRNEASQDSSFPREDRYDRGRSWRREPDAGAGIVPRQTNDRYDPILEPHVDTRSRERSVQPYERRGGEVYRSREPDSRFNERPSMPVERETRSYSRYPRSEPSYERSIDRSERNFQRSAPSYERSAPSYERSEPRAAPSYERSQPRFEPRSAPSYTPAPTRQDSGSRDFGRSSSSSSSDDGGGRSSRGQLERIIRDDD